MRAKNNSFFMSSGPTSNYQLARACQTVRYFRGVFMKDNLPKRPWHNEALIVNLNNQNQSGSHWVALVKRGSNARYFDSFGGVPPPLEVIRYLKGCKIAYNTLKHQNYEQRNCGQLCVRFLLGELKNFEKRLN